jgi:hypothetical protein
MAQPRQPLRNQGKPNETQSQKQATPQKQGKQPNQNKVKKEAARYSKIL